MDLYSILNHDACRLNIGERTKEGVLRKIAEVAASTPVVADAEVSAQRIFQQLSAREEQGSTGFGNGVALPHTRVKGMNEFLLFLVTTRKGVDFGAIDHKRVQVFFVLLGPDEQVNEHLKALAAVSRVLSNSNVKKEILGASGPTAACEAFLRNVRYVEGERPAVRKMRVLYVILYLDELLYDILEFFIEQGIEGATIVESSGMGRYISNIPLFASFIGFMNEDKTSSRMIMALVPENRVDDIIEGIEGITGDMDKKEGAMVFTTEVSFHKGTMKMM
jgi:mannitol/fructose-specific phosphotransferase system IIA component (Ntr-type)